MRLLHAVLMTLTVLALTFSPVGAAGLHRHDDHPSARAEASPHVHLHHAAKHHSAEHHVAIHAHHAASHVHNDSPPMHSSHHDGKCCGMPGCGPSAFSPVVVLALAIPLPRAVPRAPALDDRRRKGAGARLSLRPPIAA